MISEQRLEEAALLWLAENKIAQKTIDYEVTEYKPIIYNGYDAWKTATADDDYKTTDVTVDISEFLDELTECLLENVSKDFDLNEFSDDISFTDSLYTDNIFHSFESTFDMWSKDKTKELEETELEYV